MKLWCFQISFLISVSATAYDIRWPWMQLKNVILLWMFAAIIIIITIIMYSSEKTGWLLDHNLHLTYHNTQHPLTSYPLQNKVSSNYPTTATFFLLFWWSLNTFTWKTATYKFLNSVSWFCIVNDGPAAKYNSFNFQKSLFQHS